MYCSLHYLHGTSLKTLHKLLFRDCPLFLFFASHLLPSRSVFLYDPCRGSYGDAQLVTKCFSRKRKKQFCSWKRLRYPRTTSSFFSKQKHCIPRGRKGTGNEILSASLRGAVKVPERNSPKSYISEIEWAPLPTDVFAELTLEGRRGRKWVGKVSIT